MDASQRKVGTSSKRNACSMLAKRSPRLLPSDMAAVWTGKDESSGSAFENRAERTGCPAEESCISCQVKKVIFCDGYPTHHHDGYSTTVSG